MKKLFKKLMIVVSPFTTQFTIIHPSAAIKSIPKNQLTTTFVCQEKDFKF